MYILYIHILYIVYIVKYIYICKILGFGIRVGIRLRDELGLLKLQQYRDRCYYNQKILPWVISYFCLYILSFVGFLYLRFYGPEHVYFLCNRIIFWQAKGIFRPILPVILFPFCWEHQLCQLWKSSCTTWVVIKSFSMSIWMSIWMYFDQESWS